MEDTIIKLAMQFNEIIKLGWVESKRAGSTGIGYTFERLLNCEENNLSYPDYDGIEIKTKRFYTVGYISLFNIASDGDTLFSLNDLYNSFGYPDKIFPQFNVLNISLFANRYTNIGYSKCFKLTIDKDYNKIKIVAINKYKNITNNSVSWSFQLLKETLERKLCYLAFVKAFNKFDNKKEYFKYDTIFFYKLKDFNTFIKLIEQGIIRLTIKIGIHKSGDKFGKMKYHGCGFDINEKDLDKLFQLIQV